jgi:cyanophycinase-like exopeptidase
MRERSVDLLPAEAVLVGIDEQTALLRDGAGEWEVAGAGAVTVYRKGAKPKSVKAGASIALDPVTTR